MLLVTESDTNRFCPCAVEESSMANAAQRTVLTARMVFIHRLRFCLCKRGDNSLLVVYTIATRHTSQIHAGRQGKGRQGQRRRQGGGRDLPGILEPVILCSCERCTECVNWSGRSEDRRV